MKTDLNAESEYLYAVVEIGSPTSSLELARYAIKSKTPKRVVLTAGFAVGYGYNSHIEMTRADFTPEAALRRWREEQARRVQRAEDDLARAQRLAVMPIKGAP